MKYPSMEVYKNYFNLVNRFFSGEFTPWAYRFLIEGIENKNFIQKFSPILERTFIDLSCQEIDDLIQEIRDITKHYLNKLRSAENIDQKIDIESKLMVYFGLTECLHEHGAFAEKIVKDLISSLGENYLEKLREIDKAYISEEVARYFGRTKTQATSVQKNEDICKYLVLKKWQDDQHSFYLHQIEPIVWKIEDEYIDSKGFAAVYPANVKHVNNINALRVRAIEQLRKLPLIDVDVVSMYYLAGIREELVGVVGGKAYGLAVLRANNVQTPKSYVSPVSSKEFDFVLPPDIGNLIAVRSSADIEDGSKYSFAGMFDSYIGVPVENASIAFKKVKQSINNRRVQAYLKKSNLPKPKMAVIFQQSIKPEYSGVWIGNDPNSGILEWVAGTGEKLVSGRVTPERELWRNRKGPEKKFKNVAEDIMNIQSKVSVSGTADIEWCISNDKLVILQFRPATRKIIDKKPPKQNTLNVTKHSSSETFKGLPASPGYVCGPSTFVRKINELENWNSGDILMAWFTDPEWMEVLTKSKGIVTAVGGFLCHSAIIARELDVPCVVGIGPSAMKTIWNERYIELNGTTGEVTVKHSTVPDSSEEGSGNI